MFTFGTEVFTGWLRCVNFCMVTGATTSAWTFSNWFKMVTGKTFEVDAFQKAIESWQVAFDAWTDLVNVVPPDWSSNLFKGNIVVDESDNHILWQFHKGRRGSILVMPPYAGRPGEIVDRQITALKQLGCSIYVFELKAVDASTCGLTWDRYFDLLEGCLDVIGERAYLVGGCQGAWASFILRCRCPEKTHEEFVDMVGPLNFWAGDGIIKKNCQEAGPEYFEQVVEWNGGMQPGYAQWLGFASMAPHYFFFERYANLFWGLVELNYNQNPKPVDKWIVERNWMDAPRNLPGPWYKRVTRDLFIGNKLVRGLLKVKGKIMDMAKVKWRILAIAGGDDEITPPPQLDIREYLPKGSSFEMVTLEGHGHTKPLFSSESMKLVVAFLERALSSSQKTLPAPNAVA